MNKIALVTGSYGGLGECLCLVHAQHGGDLILVGRSREKLEAQKRKLISNFHIEVEVIACDLALPNAAQIIYNYCKDKKWNIEYLINNAGFGGVGFFAQRDIEIDMNMILVNVVTPTKLCRLFVPDFVERGAGRVLNVSSTASLIAGPLQAVYFATKAYLTSYSNAISRELKHTGVTVTTLLPGVMDTGFIARANATNTILFSHKKDASIVARKAYNAMQKGKLNITVGLALWQLVALKIAPLLPKSFILDIVYKLQENKKKHS